MYTMYIFGNFKICPATGTDAPCKPLQSSAT
jgi:hypothetical protein